MGYYLQGSLLLVWAAIGVYLAGTLLDPARARKPESVEERDRHRRPGAPLLSHGPVQQLPGHGRDELFDSAADLRLHRAGDGLQRVVGTLYPRLRGRPPVPTTATPRPIAVSRRRRPTAQDEDQDPPEEHQE